MGSRGSNPSLSPSQMVVAGIDEVGRGALFGPVVAAAVILSDAGAAELAVAGVRDSKKLGVGDRDRLARLIRMKAVDCKIGWSSAREIDRLNILQGTLLAMRRSILKLKPAPDRCLVDGNRLIPDLSIPQEAIVRGDTHSVAIAAASIVAKVWRDALVVRLDRIYPQYDLARNKGYGTKRHREALQKHGPCFHHRMSFAPCQLSLPLELL